jgi:hypothetical protein
MIKLTQIRQASHARLGEHSVLASCAIPNDIIQLITDTPCACDRQCHWVPGTDCRSCRLGALHAL